jgi:hypothetical protein
MNGPDFFSVILRGSAHMRLAPQDDGALYPAAFNSFSRWMISVASRK